MSAAWILQPLVFVRDTHRAGSGCVPGARVSRRFKQTCSHAVWRRSSFCHTYFNSALSETALYPNEPDFCPLDEKRDCNAGGCALCPLLSFLRDAWYHELMETYQHGENGEAEADVSSRSEGEKHVAVSAKKHRKHGVNDREGAAKA